MYMYHDDMEFLKLYCMKAKLNYINDDSNNNNDASHDEHNDNNCNNNVLYD